MIFDAIGRRRDREHNERAWLAWHIVALTRSKKLPRLEVMMAKRRASAMRQSWQEQQRIMDMWVAVTRRRSQLMKGK